MHAMEDQSASWLINRKTEEEACNTADVRLLPPCNPVAAYEPTRRSDPWVGRKKLRYAGRCELFTSGDMSCKSIMQLDVFAACCVPPGRFASLEIQTGLDGNVIGLSAMGARPNELGSQWAGDADSRKGRRPTPRTGNRQSCWLGGGTGAALLATG